MSALGAQENIRTGDGMKQWLVGMCLWAVAGMVSAQAAKQPWDEYDKLIGKTQSVGALGPDLFGDAVSFYNGALSFTATDVSLPGNHALPVAFTRSFTVANRWGDDIHDGAMADWELETPRLEGVFSTGGWQSACTVTASNGGRPPVLSAGGEYFLPTDYWAGNQLIIPGRGSEEMLLASQADVPKPATGGPYPWVTSSLTYFTCIPRQNAAGEGFLAIAADGTRYWFDWQSAYYESSLKKGQGTLPRRRVTLSATRVEDRFGNWVTYTYTNASTGPARLASIQSSDNRVITVGYNPQGHIATVTANNRTWSYQYQYPTAGTGSLTAVVLPDSSRWNINFASLADSKFRYHVILSEGNLPPGVPPEAYRDCFNPGDPAAGTPASFVGTITHPSGAVGEFTVGLQSFGRSNVPAVCGGFSAVGNNPNDDVAYYPIRWDAFALRKKRITGPALTAAEWNYSYASLSSWFMHASGGGYPLCGSGSDCSAPQCVGDSCAGTASTMVSGPGGQWQRYSFGNSYRYNEGKLLKIETGTGPLSILSTQSNVYQLNPVGQPYPAKIGTSPQYRTDNYASEILTPQRSTAIVRDGVTFSSLINTFDTYARPLSTTKSSTLGYTKTETATYLDDTAQWVLGLPLTSSVNGIEVSKTDYNAQRLPWKTYSFGKLQNTLTYHANGTLATVTDGRSNATTLSNWKRGIPQSILHPATSEAPTGATESAVVDDNGWIASTTDENGYTSGYAYDAMGRLAGMSYPSGDSVVWLPKAFEFRALTASDWLPPGIAVGQWRHYEGQGNYAKFTYFDAQWRPVLVQEYDTGNVMPTLRYTRTAYDSNGRVSFQSYPVSDPTAATTGTRTFYDALDRVTSVEQDSELGTLTTNTQYLPGLQVKVTNPRGFHTTTGYAAWDRPGYDIPAWSVEPEDKVTEIVRDALGRPITLVRRNAGNTLRAERRYVYDGQGQLCKTLEPETGATVMGYDAAGNLAWAAAGLDRSAAAYSAITDCSYSAANASGRVVNRSYDAKNRLTALSFPDGIGNQVWTYEKDDLPATIVAYNGAGNTVPVANAYVYNKRRMLNGQGESVSQTGWYSWGIGYNYNGNGALSTQTYPTGLVVDYAPNALGQATKAGAFASNASYYPNGALKQFTYGNGIMHAMTQNARQLPVRSTSGGGVSDLGYVYDANANIGSITDYVRGAGFDRAMSYDGLDRLSTASAASFGGDGVHRFAYDALDNLKSWKLAGVKDYAEYVYDQNHRLTNLRNTAGASVVGLNYDPQGNLSNKNGQVYSFDYGNRLRTVVGKESYRYDGLGRRVMASDATGAIFSQYAQSGQLMYQENYRGAQTVSSEHVSLAGSLVASRETTWGAGVAVKYQHTDALGSPVAISNQAGAVIERNDYEPYGAIIGKPNRSGIGYTGHVMDGGTGLTYMQQRYYDQSVGRFLSVDPVTADPNTGAMFNRYNYANNNPYRFTDPDGRAALIRTAWTIARGASKTVPKSAPKSAPKPASGQQTKRQSQQPAGQQPKPDSKQENKHPDRPLPRDKHGNPVPDPEAAGKPHSQLGQRAESGGSGQKYDQAREFDANGKPVRDIDFTDHNRPSQHTNPHQHHYKENSTGGTLQRGKSEPLDP
jgi:RHS repeat-associated protein